MVSQRVSSYKGVFSKYGLSILLITLMLSALAGAEELEVGYFTMGPHIYVGEESREAEGPLPELLRNHVGPAMGVKINLVEMPLIRVLTEMKKGTIAAAAMFGYTDERAKEHIYPDEHFSQMQSVLVVRNDHPLQKVSSIEDLYALNIAYVRAAILTPFVRDPKLSWEWTTGNNVWRRNLRKVLTGRVDATYSPQWVNMLYGAYKLDAAGDIRILPLPEPLQNLYTLFSNHPSRAGLSQRYDEAMRVIDGRVVYKRLLEKYPFCQPGMDECSK